MRGDQINLIVHLYTQFSRGVVKVTRRIIFCLLLETSKITNGRGDISFPNLIGQQARLSV